TPLGAGLKSGSVDIEPHAPRAMTTGTGGRAAGSVACAPVAFFRVACVASRAHGGPMKAFPRGEVCNALAALVLGGMMWVSNIAGAAVPVTELQTALDACNMAVLLGEWDAGIKACNHALALDPDA